MKKVIISSVIALAMVASAAPAMAATSYVFSNYLSVGSRGADVSALQSWLVSSGFLTMPTGVPMGYFGSLTKAAVVAYQASVGLPSTGYVGPLTVAKLNAAGGVVSVTPPASFVCPPGWTCMAPTGTVTGGTTGGTSGITTPGAEGILSVTQGPVSNSVLTAGQTKAPILDVRMQAQNSDIAVQRITVDLGSSTNVFNYVYTNIYLIDPVSGAVLTTVPLNSSTVVQSGTDYVLNLTGFNYIVPKNTYKDLVIAVDLQNSIISNFLGSYSVSVQSNGVRGIDGAGVDQYGPGSGSISQTISVNQSLTLNSQVNVSLDGGTVQVNAIPVTDTTNGNYLQLPVMTFDILAQNDNMHVHNLVLQFASNATSSITAAYLFDGATLITSAAVASNGTATFLNLPDSGTGSVVIPVNTSKQLSVKADVTGVGATPVTVTAAFKSSGSTFYNSIDASAFAVNGSATGNTQTVLGKGPGLVLNSTPVAVVTGTNVDPSSSQAMATSTISANFNVSVTAVGTNVFFNGQGTSTPTFTFNVYDQNGNVLSQGAVKTANTIVGVGPTPVAPTSGMVIPTGSSIISLGNGYYEIPQGATVTLTPTFTFAGRYGDSSHIISPVTVGIAGFTYSNAQGFVSATSTYMASSTQWRTQPVTSN